MTDRAGNRRDHMILQDARRDRLLRNSTGQGHGQRVGQGHLQNRKVMVGDQVRKPFFAWNWRKFVKKQKLEFNQTLTSPNSMFLQVFFSAR